MPSSFHERFAYEAEIDNRLSIGTPCRPARPGFVRDLGDLPIGEAQYKDAFLITPFNEHSARLSPNGEWVSYVSDQTGDYRIYVQRFPEGGMVIPISAGAGTEAVWSGDGQELFYRNENHVMVVAIDPGSELVAGGTSLVFEDTYVRDVLNQGRPNYDVSSDGQRFLMIRQDESPDAGKIVLVFNWFQELTERVPIP